MTREEAINKVRQMSLPKETMEIFQALAPELAESEDERIRKWIVKFVTEQYPECWKDKKNKMLAYLEKQKECVSNNFDDVWDEEDCEEIIAEGQKLTPRFKELLKEVCHAWYDRGAYLEKQKEPKPLPPFDEPTPEEKMNHPLYLEGFDTGRKVQRVFDEQKPVDWSEEEKAIIHGCINRICVPDKYIDHSNDARSIAFLESLLNGQRIREGCMGIKGPSCDPGRRGRMGGVPKEISKEAEAFQAKFPGPYDEDDIITAYETAKMKAIEDLPKWKEAKAYGKGECTIGSAFEATGRRYPILYCYGYGISIEQLFEKLPKKED